MLHLVVCWERHTGPGTAACCGAVWPAAFQPADGRACLRLPPCPAALGAHCLPHTSAGWLAETCDRLHAAPNLLQARHNGSNYVFALLLGYREPPAGISVRSEWGHTSLICAGSQPRGLRCCRPTWACGHRGPPARPVCSHAVLMPRSCVRCAGSDGARPGQPSREMCAARCAPTMLAVSLVQVLEGLDQRPCLRDGALAAPCATCFITRRLDCVSFCCYDRCARACTTTPTSPAAPSPCPRC